MVDRHPAYYWPSEAPMEGGVAAFVTAFGILGYEPCANGALEDGFEKVAIYALPSGVTHMARQLDTGRWTSKIGGLEDIDHASPAELEGARVRRRRAVHAKASGLIATDNHRQGYPEP